MRPIHAITIIAGILTASCSHNPRKVEANLLSDAVIAASKEARIAGASKLTYEAAVTTAYGAEGALVIPFGVLAPTLGASATRTVGSTVTVEVDLAQVNAQKARVMSGKRYILDLGTMHATEIR